MPSKCFTERFAALEHIEGLRHGFIGREPGLEIAVDRVAALERLAQPHALARARLGIGSEFRVIFGEQIHGQALATVDQLSPTMIPGVDGLITATPGIALGIYVADCCAIYLFDPIQRVIALLHSGRKGTQLGIASGAIAKMIQDFGCRPERMIAQLSPCIRPPHFETDFAAEIVQQCQAAGIEQVFDPGTCTASHPALYYSYRAEHGRTGRMLALLAMAA